MTFQLRIAARMDVGMVRDHQEDDYAIASDLSADYWGFNKNEPFSPGALGTLLIVADGMGGANAGEVASSTAVEGVRYFFSKIREMGLGLEQMPKTISELLRDAILQAHQHILHKVEQSPETQGMGTTIVVAWIIDQVAHVAWVGDSRCYQMSTKQGLIAVSKDHSYVQQLIDRGELKEEAAFLHPHRNVILQSLGGAVQLPKPSYTKILLEPGDRLLLCSDGLNTMLNDASLQTILGQEPNTDDCVRKLIQSANDAGGRDNITVALADVVSDKPVSYPSIAAPTQSAIKTTASAANEQSQAIGSSTFTHEPRMDIPPRKRQYWPILAVIVVLAGVIALLYWANMARSIENKEKDKKPPLDPAAIAAIELPDTVSAEQQAKIDSLAKARKASKADSATNNTPSVNLTFVLSRNYETRPEAQFRRRSLVKQLPSKYTVNILASTNCGQAASQSVDSCYEVIINAFGSRSAADSFKRKNPVLLQYFAPKRDRVNPH